MMYLVVGVRVMLMILIQSQRVVVNFENKEEESSNFISIRVKESHLPFDRWDSFVTNR